MGLVLLAQKVLVLLTDLAEVLLVLGAGGQETHHNLLHDTGLAEGFNAACHVACLGSPSLSHILVLLLPCKSLLIEEGQAEKRLCGEPLRRILTLRSSQEVLHLRAHLLVIVVGTALSRPHKQILRQ